MRIVYATRGRAFVEHGQELSRRLPGHEFLFVDKAAGQRAEELGAADVLIATSGYAVDREVLAAHRCGFVQTIGTGYEHISLDDATTAGVWVANLSAAATGNADSVAEMAIFLMLGLARQARRAGRAFREGAWATPRGAALLEKEACIVGLGDIGAALATRLLAFGMRVSATRRDASKGGPAGVKVLPAERMYEALRTADHVIVCARASAGNKHLIDGRAIGAMKSGAMLINIARGSILDLEAARTALAANHLGGLGLDVFPQEPFDPNEPLLRDERVFVMPHVGGVTDVHARKSLVLLVENIERYARGERPRFLLNGPINPLRPLA